MTADLRHPPQLKILFFTEMWERFGYYLMLGILPLYLSDKEKGGMGWSDTEAAVVVGSYIALVYLTPFIGGIIADRVLGFRKTIVIGAMLMMTGYFMMAIPNKWGLYAALLVIILGNGAFKPNISALLGRLYPPGSPLKDAGYNIFYMGINLGAFACNFVAAFVRNYFDAHPDYGIRGWNAAFCTAGFGMLFGLLIFSANYRKFTAEDPDPRTFHGERQSLRPLWVLCVIPALLLGLLGYVIGGGLKQLFPEALGGVSLAGGLKEMIPGFPFNAATTAFLAACIPVVFFFIYVWRSLPVAQDRSRVAALLVIYTVVIVFWMTFHLNTTALNFWARDDTDRVPTPTVRIITDAMPEFAENAPAGYFGNAGPAIPRPARSSYIVVSPEKFEELSKANKLWDLRRDPSTNQESVYVHVTQEMLDNVYRRANESTPILPEGQPLKLVNTELFQSINAGQVVLFTPFVVGFFALLRRRGLEPTTPAKMGLGLLINAGAPMMMYLATWASNNSEMKVTAWWLFGTYAIATLGELCLSPMGLSLVSKVSPPQITAFMMGGYFLSTSIGNKLSGIFGELYTEMDHYQFWTILIVCNLTFGLIIFILLGWLKRQMGSALH